MTETTAHWIVRLSLQRMLARIEASEEELGRLDAQAGDGDHGAGMVRGLKAACASLPAPGEGSLSAGGLLEEAGNAFSDAAGGASGALVGTLILTVGQKLGEGPFALDSMCAALESGLAVVCQMGQARPGDKTLIDTLDPFVHTLRSAASDVSLAQAWQEALPAAEAGARSTAAMVSRRGRSSRLGERSRGHLDPGAVSMLYMLQAVGSALYEFADGRHAGGSQ